MAIGARFVDLKEIDPRFFERPYYFVPGDDFATEGYTVIREALAKSGKASVGQVTMSGREYLVAVSTVGNVALWNPPFLAPLRASELAEVRRPNLLKLPAPRIRSRGCAGLLQTKPRPADEAAAHSVFLGGVACLRRADPGKDRQIT